VKPYPDYKPSGVAWLGDVPGHWEVKKIKHIASLQSGEGITAEAIEDAGEFPVYGGNGQRGYTNCSTHSGEFVLIGRQGALCGNVHFVTGEFWASEHAVVCTLYAGDSPKWATYMFEFMNLGQYSVSAAQPGLAVERIQLLPLATPPPAEQQAIADYLDTETTRIDALIREKLGLIGLLGERRAGVFETLLSDVARVAGGRPNPRFPWLAVLPLEWSCLKVKHVVQSLDQGISPQCEARVPDEGEWGVLKVGCVNSGVFNANESKALPPEIDPIEEITLHEGDVLVSRANTKNLVGRAAMADKAYPKLMLSDKLYRLKLDTGRCAPAFLVGFLTLPAIRVRIEERATGASASMLNIDRRTIMDLDMPLPRIARQIEIVAMAKTESAGISALLSHVTAEIALLKELRAATIADAVLGRVDVRRGS
jgi:type I restriction enzyme S subunit